MKLNPMQQLFSSVLNTWRIANTVGYKHLGVSAFYCGYGSSVDTWGGAENGVDPIRKITHNVGDLLFSMKEKIDSVITGSVELTLEVAASFLTKVSVTMLVIGGYRIPGYKHFESAAMMKREWDDNPDQAMEFGLYRQDWLQAVVYIWWFSGGDLHLSNKWIRRQV